jgi:acetyl esterase/lipase
MIAALLLAAAAFSVHVTRDVPYAKSLTLDVYEPAGGTKPHPAFIAIHGGGFTRGTKRSINAVDLCQHLAERGFACFSIDYRLGSEAMAADDAVRAVRWVVAHAKRYGADASRVAVGGDSAGAITALNVAYRRKTPHVGAVLSWAGGLDGDENVIERGAGARRARVEGRADARGLHS